MTRPVAVGVDQSETARRAAFRAAEMVFGAEQFLHALRGELPVSEISHAVVSDDPAAAICDEAERLEAQMIVVGNKRVQGISRVLGAIATDVARRASCDVLISDTTSDA